MYYYEYYQRKGNLQREQKGIKLTLSTMPFSGWLAGFYCKVSMYVSTSYDEYVPRLIMFHAPGGVAVATSDIAKRNWTDIVTFFYLGFSITNCKIPRICGDSFSPYTSIYLDTNIRVMLCWIGCLVSCLALFRTELYSRCPDHVD